MVHTNIPRHDLIKKPEISLAESVKTTESLFTQHNLRDLNTLRNETKYGTELARALKFHVRCPLASAAPNTRHRVSLCNSSVKAPMLSNGITEIKTHAKQQLQLHSKGSEEKRFSK